MNMEQESTKDGNIEQTNMEHGLMKDGNIEQMNMEHGIMKVIHNTANRTDEYGEESLIVYYFFIRNSLLICSIFFSPSINKGTE